jgi:hypothetical protein
MKYLSQREYERKLKEVQRENESIDRYNKLKKEKRKVSIDIKKPTTDKLIAIYLFIILNVILVYSMISMWNFADLSCLGVLVTDIAGQVITYYIYAKKATAQNTKGGITYDMAMLEHGLSDVNNDVGTSDSSAQG